jgi:hypothetical protein
LYVNRFWIGFFLTATVNISLLIIGVYFHSTNFPSDIPNSILLIFTVNMLIYTFVRMLKRKYFLSDLKLFYLFLFYFFNRPEFDHDLVIHCLYITCTDARESKHYFQQCVSNAHHSIVVLLVGLVNIMWLIFIITYQPAGFALDIMVTFAGNYLIYLVIYSVTKYRVK